MNAIVQDLRHAGRMMARNPGFTAVVAITLALGIGATSTVFTLVNGELLKPLPYEEPERLVMVWETFRQQQEGSVSYPNLEDWRAHNRVFERFAGFRPWPQTLTGLGDPERVMGALVTADFFPALRVQPALGRLFTPADDRPGADNVLVVSNGFWRRRLNADPAAIDRVVTLTGMPFTIVGVLPAGFRFPVRIGEAEIFTSAGMDPGEQSERGWPMLGVLGRLNPGATRAQAQEQMDATQGWLSEEYPESSLDHGMRVVPLHEQVVGHTRPLLGLLSGAALMVLVVACANVANLTLARATTRRKELAVRAAVGGTSWQLARLLVVESACLAILGGGLGVLLAAWGVQLLRTYLPPGFPRSDDLTLDLPVLVFTLVVATLSGVVVGLVAVWRSSRVELAPALKDGLHLDRGTGRHLLGATLVGAQVALSLVLLIGTGLLIRSVQELGRAPLGFDPRGVLTFQLRLGWNHPSTSQQREALYDAILARLKTLPGVTSVSASACLPLGGGQRFPVFPADQPAPESLRDWVDVAHNSVSPDYFQTMGIPLLRGRTFTDLDQRANRPGAVAINETLARQLWPDEDPLGKQLRSRIDIEAIDPQVFEVVGIVADTRDLSADAAPMPTTYFCHHQQTFPYMGFALRTTRAAHLLAEPARQAVAQVTTREAVFRVQTMAEVLHTSDAFVHRRFPLLLLALFAAVAALLAGVGIYGMLSYVVIQQRHDIGVRLAVGAQTGAVLRLMLCRGLRPALLGAGAGVLLAVACTRLLEQQLYGVAATDPLTFVAVTIAVLAIALWASFWPARRATLVDPLTALRCE